MKKMSKLLSTAAVTLLMIIISAVTAFAAEDDICLFEGEGRSPRSWGQAFEYNLHEEGAPLFSLTELKKETKLFVEFELESEPPEGFAGLEFILYRRKSADTKSIWARVEPSEIVNGVAVFEYADMVEAVGSDDLEIIDSIYVGDTDNELLVKKVTIDINGDNVLESPADAEDDNKEETTAKSDSKDKSPEKSDEEAESGGVNFVLIIVIAVVVIAAVVVVLVLKNRKKYY